MGCLKRLSSYASWPSESASVSPVHLANAGFMYSGTEDRVTCPVCQIEIGGWLSGGLSSPTEEHRRRSPRCSSVVECSKSASDVVARVEKLLADRSTHDSRSGDEMRGSVASPGISPGGRSDKLAEVFKSALHRAKLNGVFGSSSEPDTTPSVPPIDRKIPDYDRLKFETTRLRTYNDWPSTACVRPSELAANGWFYTGEHDRVCCAFCRGVLHHWTKDDVPSSEHRKHFPHCPFVRGLDVGNVPLGQKQTTPVTGASNAVQTIERGPTFVTDVSRPGATSADTQHHNHESNSSKFDQSATASGSRTTEDVSSYNANNREARNIDTESRQCTAAEKFQSPSINDDEEEQKLLEENRQLIAARTCKVCMDKEVNTVFLPCGHLVTCHDCAPKLRDCPVCRTYIRGTVKTFLS